MSQISIPAVFMRGGTSRALFFHRRDLPPTPSPNDYAGWNEIFLAAMGSPDPYGRQLDGMGGGQSSLSKIAVIAPSERPDVDVDFTFAQVGIEDGTVGYTGTCGNISSAVGPFAVDEGLVTPAGDTTTVRIFNTNTSRLIVATFAVRDGKAAIAGDYALQGVAGRGAPIRLAFLEPGGATTGRLLPTGQATDRLDLDDGTSVEASLIDAANPVVCVMAGAIGLQGTEAPAALREDETAMAQFERIRIAAAVVMGLASDQDEAAKRMKNLPLVALLAKRRASRSTIPGDGYTPHLEVRMISAGLPHGAIPLTGALGLAVAARVPGTLVHALMPENAGDGRIVIAHAGGGIDVEADVAAVNGEFHVREAVVYRTARRLMAGRVFLPI